MFEKDAFKNKIVITLTKSLLTERGTVHRGQVDHQTTGADR